MGEKLASTDFKFIIESINYLPGEILKIFAYYASYLIKTRFNELNENL